MVLLVVELSVVVLSVGLGVVEKLQIADVQFAISFLVSQLHTVQLSLLLKSPGFEQFWLLPSNGNFLTSKFSPQSDRIVSDKMTPSVNRILWLNFILKVEQLLILFVCFENCFISRFFCFCVLARGELYLELKYSRSRIVFIKNAAESD